MIEPIARAVARCKQLVREKKKGTFEPSDKAFFREQAFNELGARAAVIRLRRHKIVNKVYFYHRDPWPIAIELHRAAALRLEQRVAQAGGRLASKVVDQQSAKALVIGQRELAHLLPPSTGKGVVIKIRQRDLQTALEVLFGKGTTPQARIQVFVPEAPPLLRKVS